MGIVNPKLAASLAEEIYIVHDAVRLKLMFSRPEFSSNKEAATSRDLLTAHVGTRLINTRDAFGVCARGGGQYANDIFIIFRGTTGGNYGADFFTDARTGLNISSTGGVVHAGFNHVFNSLRDQLGQFVSQQKGIESIHCIGHSLGGAVANLAADWLSSRYGGKVRLYTFGAPRVGLGTSGFAHKLTCKLKSKNIFRAYHRTDPVPMVPVFPFTHAPTSGLSYYLPYGGLVISFKAHYMDNYIRSVSDKSWSALYSPEPTFLADVKSWLKNEDREAATSAVFWEKLNHAAAFVVQSVMAATAAPLFVTGLTVADYLAAILLKGVKLAGEVSQWVYFLIRKIMRTLGMKVVDSVAALTEQLIRMVMNKVVKRIHQEVQKAIRQF